MLAATFCTASAFVGGQIAFERGANAADDEVVSRPADRSYPDLARALSEQIGRETGRAERLVTVEYLERRQYDPERARSASRPDT